MIGLDTNVVVRHLTQDDPVQSRKASRLIEETLSESNPGFVSVVVMAEISWVLERSYGVRGPALASIIERMLEADVLSIECEQQVFAAMIDLKEGRGSFGDALIGALNVHAGCTRTLTFDKGALRLPTFQAL